MSFGPRAGRLFRAVLSCSWHGSPRADAAGPSPAQIPGETRNAIRALLGDELTAAGIRGRSTASTAGSTRTFARDWSPRPDDSKFLVYQARMTWTAAAFADSHGPPR